MNNNIQKVVKSPKSYRLGNMQLLINELAGEKERSANYLVKQAVKEFLIKMGKIS